MPDRPASAAALFRDSRTRHIKLPADSTVFLSFSQEHHPPNVLTGDLLAVHNMPTTLKTLLGKLKKRRKSKSAALHAQKPGPDDRFANSSLPITEALAKMAVSELPGDGVSLGSDKRNMLTFGASDDLDFAFTVESPTKWPGPAYDKFSMFAPGVFDKARPTRPKTRQKSSKRKLSQEGGQVKLRPKELPSTKTVRDVVPSKKSPRPVHYYGPPPARDPPHNLLNLPGEIRNQIYRMLCVSHEPIIAQFRPIIRPKRGRGDRAKLFQTTKRFPREPTLALVSRQLMTEVLSIFYSDNTFVFRRNDEKRFEDLIMTHAPMIKRWTPLHNLADSLRSVEVHFTIYGTSTGGSKDTIIYSLRRLADESLQVSNNAHAVAPDYCKCFDQNFMLESKKTLEGQKHFGNLLVAAAELPVCRTERLILDPDISMPFSTLLYRPKKMTCENCGLNTLRAMESGL